MITLLNGIKKSSFALAMGGLVFLGASASSALALEVGGTAPCVVLDQLQANGSETTGCIRDQIAPEHQYTLIEFSSIYCQYCEENLPTITALTKELASSLTVRQVYIDKKVLDIKKHLASHAGEIVFPVAFDIDRDAKKAYDVTATPTHFLLDKNNKVVLKVVGSLEKSDLDAIRKLVNTSH